MKVHIRSIISIVLLVSDLCHFQMKAFFQRKYFNCGTLSRTIVPNLYSDSVRYMAYHRVERELKQANKKKQTCKWMGR